MKATTIAVVAPAPPPLTGQSIYYPYLAHIIGEDGVVYFPLRPRPLSGGFFSYVRKFLRVISTVAKVLSGPKLRSAVIVVDAGLGLILNILSISALRIRGARIFISHHTFKYVDQYSLLCDLLVNVAGRRAVHLFLCDGMREKFTANYKISSSIIINNAKRVSFETPGEVTYTQSPEFVVGYISNISFEKGIDKFVEILLESNRSGNRLIKGLIAGPAANAEVEDYLRSVCDSHPNIFQWVGPVYRQEKVEFYETISALLFPTAYEVEAQPNVVLEALRFGRPCIATARGCIPSDIHGSGSELLSSVDLVSSGAAIISAMASEYERGEWEARAMAAQKRFSELCSEAGRAEAELVKSLRSPSDNK